MTDQTGFGRLISKDERDRNYKMGRILQASAVHQKYWWTPPAYDQGATSQCVAYSGVRYLESSPIRNFPIDYTILYKACQKEDEWPGEDYDGTSVRALFKILKKEEFITEYRWAFECEPVVDHLLTFGPVVLGTFWTDSMANIGNDGYVSVGEISANAGGHAWCAVGANRNRRNPDGSKGAVRAVNSWGKSWGPDEGRFWISFKDLDRLIKADGEACVATEVKKG